MQKWYFNKPSINDTPIKISVKQWSESFPTKHIHDFYEIVFIRQNSLVNVINEHSRVMYKNDFCLVLPDDTHYIVPHEQEQPLYFNIMIRRDWLQDFTQLISDDYLSQLSKKQYATCSTGLYEECIQLLEQALQLPLSQIAYKQYLLHVVVVKLLTSFPQNIGKNSVLSSHPTLVDRAISLMYEPENLLATIKDIAFLLNVSCEHLTRSFKKLGKPSPNTVFTDIKLEYACNLLISTDLKIITVAEKIGFYNLSYFNKLFRTRFHLSPKEYRKRHERISITEKPKEP